MPELIAQSVPPLSGREKADLHCAIFVSQRPKFKPQTRGNVAIAEARDVLAALR